MIIGNGMIAKSLSNIDKDDVIFFASGVSNSSTVEKASFDREANLLNNFIGSKKKLVYFSSVPDYIQNSKYRDHKLQMEKIIENNFEDFIILRLPQIVGKGGNSKNFFNHFISAITNELPLNIRNSYRSLLDIDDLKRIVSRLIESNFIGVFEINCIEKMKVLDIVNLIASKLGKELKIEIVQDEIAHIRKNSDFVENILKESSITKYDYTKKLIEKYV